MRKLIQIKIKYSNNRLLLARNKEHPNVIILDEIKTNVESDPLEKFVLLAIKKNYKKFKRFITKI